MGRSLSPEAGARSAWWRNLQLDSESPQPYFAQISHQLRRLIESGKLSDGAHLPAERTLSELLQISRTTVKRGYDELRNAGLLRTHGRGGTVVRAVPVVRPALGKLKGFTQEMQELGKTPGTRVQERAIVSDASIAAIFGRPSHAAFLRLVRVRLADGVPMTRETAWYDLGLAPALGQWDAAGSAYGFLRETCGLDLSWADQSVEAVASTPIENDVFGFESARPCLLFKRRTYTRQDQMVEYVEGVFRGDAYVYKLRLG